MIEQTPEQRRHALAFNAVAPALKEHDQWLPLSVRKAVAEAVLAAADSDVSPSQPVVQDLALELHRRVTHLETARAADEDAVPNEKWLQVMGEVIGLQGALGIALGGRVQGGDADELAQAHYRRWITEHAAEMSRCDCGLCLERMEAGR